MKTLSNTWFAEGYIDFEMKKYTLLAYLQEVKSYFSQQKLYPQLADLIFHYNNLVQFKENKKFLQEQFPKKLTGIQIEKLQLLYEQIIEDDEMMEEMESIIHYATGEMKNTIQSGAEIYEEVEDNIRIEPVGLIPLDTREGYFFLVNAGIADTRIYQYHLSIFERRDEKYRALKTEFLAEWKRSIGNTYEQMKTRLLREKKELSNPAVFTIETPGTYPLDETLLPIAKRCLVRHVSRAA